MIHSEEDDEFDRIARENKLKSSGMECCTYDCIQGRDCPVRKAKWNDTKPDHSKLIADVRQMRDVQGQDGNWDFDPYMQGLYNGLEFALSILERREPVFKNEPKAWISKSKTR
jgi:hypothetical protein